MNSPVPPVRPAVYGRNYSYFSHRIFVAFLPEDLHLYLHKLMEPEEPVEPSEKIDMQLVRWVLLHQSQLNALSLNRLIEAWRGADNQLLLPAAGALRSLPHYRTEITLQFALELALAEAQNHPMLHNRPRLQLPLLDAAYYASRQRAEQDRQGHAEPIAGEECCDLDLSQQGLGRFATYLARRMNLLEDRSTGRPQHPAGPEPQPLSEAEIQWLYGVAIGVARTLSSGASSQDLQLRWHQHHAQRWAALRIPVPDDSLFTTLLVGDEAPLQVVGSVPGAGVDSHRFNWRQPPQGDAVWAQSLKGAAEFHRSATEFLQRADGALRLAMHGPAAAAQVAPLLQLSDHWRVLPTTPDWSAVDSALSHLQQAALGLGQLDAVRHHGLLLRRYAIALSSPASADAVTLALVVAAALAGLCHPPDNPPEQPSPAAWEAAFNGLREGLRLEQVDLPEAALRLRSLHQQLSALLPLPPWAEPSNVRAGAPPADTLALDPDWLESGWRASFFERSEAVKQAFAAGCRAGGGVPPRLVDEAWSRVMYRLLSLSRGQVDTQPATLAELVCALHGAGPGKWLPLRPEAAGYRSWTRVLLQTLRHKDRMPPALVAHALERLGVQPLAPEAQHALLKQLLREPAQVQAYIEVQAYIDQHALWSGSLAHTTNPVALVAGLPGRSLCDDWPLPPKAGLVLAITEAELDDLLKSGFGAWIATLQEPLRIGFESWTAGSDTSAPWLRRLKGWAGRQEPVALWLYAAGQAGARTPQLVDPASADDLWAIGSGTAASSGPR